MEKTNRKYVVVRMAECIAICIIIALGVYGAVNGSVISFFAMYAIIATGLALENASSFKEFMSLAWRFAMIAVIINVADMVTCELFTKGSTLQVGLYVTLVVPTLWSLMTEIVKKCEGNCIRIK